MSWSADSGQIQAGDDVYGSDGDKVGTVAAVYPGYVVVEKGWFFPTDYYIPLEAVNAVDNGQVFLNVTKDAALQSGWDTVPDAVAADTGVIVADDVVTGARDYADDRVIATQATGEEEIRVPVVEEELTATVRPVEAGAVRIEKHVVAEERVLDVPVTEERVRVERRIVDRPAVAAEVDAFQETVIEVPVTREEVELRKHARVVEEVVVGKEAVHRTEQVRGTVRREEVVVDEDAVVDAALLDEAEDRASSRP